uniref:Uncharacterized protein n=1 Tax=Anguilla anguilla TaxID=7936 RepID=A0A0E9W5Q3_ANGAN
MKRQQTKMSLCG